MSDIRAAKCPIVSACIDSKARGAYNSNRKRTRGRARSEGVREMTTFTICNARALCGGKLTQPTNVQVQDGKIIEIGGAPKGEKIDAKGAILAAGYIDVHTHGGWGKDCMEPTRECIETIARYHLSTGITGFVPTTMTASMQDIDAAVDNIRKYDSPYARILGVHLEGPYLSRKAAGAHPPQFLVDPTDENTEIVFKNADIVTRITVAPDRGNAAQFCRKATQAGMQISLGHDTSIDDEIYPCIDAGATSVTHMYNCTSRPSRRDNPKKHLGLTEVGLTDDRIVCEVIADNRHVPDALFGMIYKLKGWQGICLVSDSLSVAGMPAGDYYIGAGESRQSIRVEDGVAVLPAENTYAGSVTPVSEMARRLHALGYPIEQCISMATLVPARLIGRKDCGDIAVGMRADLNLLDDKLNILQTWLGGNVVERPTL